MERLNRCYVEIIAEKQDLAACLSHLVSSESYRMLNGWSYSLKPECLRLGSRAFNLPDSTDVILLYWYYCCYIYSLLHCFLVLYQTEPQQLDTEDREVVNETANEIKKKRDMKQGRSKSAKKQKLDLNENEDNNDDAENGKDKSHGGQLQTITVIYMNTILSVKIRCLYWC